MANPGIDELDLAIIKALQVDARTTYTRIAREQGVTVDTITSRYQRLKRRDIITRTTLLLDPLRLGNQIIACFGIDVEPQSIAEVLAFLGKQEGLIFSTHTVGIHSIFSITIAKNMNELNNIKEHIQSHNMVREVKTVIWQGKFRLRPQNIDLDHVREVVT